ncbi:MAG TPA: alginate lyase family protein [Leucothrix sp.]|nr:alginate lyase family protein [Leucothrix sp.]
MKDKLVTWYRLGLKNIAMVAFYRVLKKGGYYRYILPISKLPEVSIFSNNVADSTKKHNVDYFSFHSIDVSSPPNWFLNPWNNKEAPSYKSDKNREGGLSDNHWSTIPDFMPELGDIKLVWELSRFDWLPKMAWAYKQGDQSALPLLELWLRDWVIQNPVNNGINWKCGQEASLRCLNLIASSLMIDSAFEKPSSGFLSLLEVHLGRITPTLRYAMAQDNNHGTSEAAALFVVGEYLAQYGTDKQKKKANKWSRQGRHWLENRILQLVMNDGSFSQHSVTYHRLFLDTLSFVELIRVRLNANDFSLAFYQRMKKAVEWLYFMTDEISGDAPNLGANDGAFLFNFNNTQYRDFRPSVQLGAITFLRESFFGYEKIQHPLLKLFNIENNSFSLKPKKQSGFLLEDGAYGFINKDEGFAMMRLPVFKFRPSHADAHHIDIWHKGINLIRDGGTYSYNTGIELMEYFSGTKSHSTIQFDNKDQMPKLGRFLFGNWLRPDELGVSKLDKKITSAYTDFQNRFHKRSITSTPLGWKIIDKFKGFNSKATLRWRLAPADWEIENNKVTGKYFDLEIKSNLNVSLKLSEADESHYYMHKHKIPVLEVCTKESGMIETIITLH